MVTWTSWSSTRKTMVDPADLRFTQESVGSHFKSPHAHVSLNEVVDKIPNGRMTPDDFPRVRVISHNGFLWAIDNRRLWIFRMAKCSEINVMMMTTMHPRLEEVIRSPSLYRRLSKADFLPRVRRSRNESSSSSSLWEEAYKLFKVLGIICFFFMIFGGKKFPNFSKFFW